MEALSEQLGKLDLNACSADELRQATNSVVGAATAAAIIDYRRCAGRFKDYDELLKISGIGQAKMNALRKYTRIEGCRTMLSQVSTTDSPAPLAEPKDMIDINVASAAELQRLKGVGPSVASGIVAHRAQRGGFKSLDDLLLVSGIGKARLKDIQRQGLAFVRLSEKRKSLPTDDGAAIAGLAKTEEGIITERSPDKPSQSYQRHPSVPSAPPLEDEPPETLQFLPQGLEQSGIGQGAIHTTDTTTTGTNIGCSGTRTNEQALSPTGAGHVALGHGTRSSERALIDLPPALPLEKGKYMFVSYSSRDKALVMSVAQKLLQANIPIWLDCQQIRPGDMWDRQLGLGLLSCQGGLFCLSNSWFLSENCKSELRAVRRRLEAKEIPSTAIWPIVIGEWNGEIPPDCFYNLCADSVQRLDLSGDVNSPEWAHTMDTLVTCLRSFLQT